MFQRINELLFEDFPGEFESIHDLGESVQRVATLRGAEHRVDSTFGTLQGTVTRTFVELNWTGAWSNNSSPPRFTGAFEARQGRVYLVGCFSIPTGVKLVTGLWVVGSAIATVVTAAMALTGHAQSEAVWNSLVMLGLGLGMAWLVNYHARKEIRWMCTLVSRALQH
jgi:hypothetical protein